MTSRAAALALTLATPAAAVPASPQASPVTWDARSLMVDGRRLVVWSAEFHPFRLPSPDLWRDVLQKLKASGFNTVSIYVDWGYHSPAPGVYDFTGIRDIDRLLDMAAAEGLYVITRTGPYVNAELSRGGFPGWLATQRARARTDDPAYLAAVDEWMGRIDAIVARHQIGRGGTVILNQIENELPLTGPAQSRYMAHLVAKARADGITVPLFHNDAGRNGRWVPENSGVAGTVPAPLDLYAFDGYPGGTCTVAGKTTRTGPAPDWGDFGPGGARGGATASPKTPGFMAEMGGGWFDYWGSNGNYPCTARQRGSAYQRAFYGANLANGITVHSVYMGYGGTSWGWLPAPVVYTSYDYGAPIAEDRSLRDKAGGLKQLGGMIAAVPAIAAMVAVPTPPLADAEVTVHQRRDPASGARLVYVARRGGEALSPIALPLDLAGGRCVLSLAVATGDATTLVADVGLGGQHLACSSSELQSALRIDGGDVLLLRGRAGTGGRTVLAYAAAPRVAVVEGQATSSYDAGRGQLTLDYAHAGRVVVRIDGGGRAPATVILADDAEAARYWQGATAAGEAVLVRGPALLRRVEARGPALALTGDIDAATPLELWAPARFADVRWNGEGVALASTPAGARAARRPLAGPLPFALPALDRWRVADGTPEASPSFDDRGWAAIDARASASITARPDSQPAMDMDAYGFHDGDVWYRGRFAGGPDARSLAVQYGAGGAGMIQLFLDGQLVGEHRLPGGLPRPLTMGVARFDLPEAATRGGEHVLAAMVRVSGHNWDLDADDAHKEARGIVSASLSAPGGRSFAVPIAWRIQGAQGGETLADPARGVANAGGQYGERQGWHLPDFDDAGWREATLGTPAPAGTTWYRTRFRLVVPAGQDATIAVAFGDPATPRSPRTTRALLFVNGWNMGQFVADVGPQRVFPVPEGILDHRGDNVVALAVTSDGDPRNAPEPVRLVALRDVRGGVPVRLVAAPRRLPVRP